MNVPDETRRDLTDEQIIKWSDSWTEEDLREVTAAAVRHTETANDETTGEMAQNQPTERLKQLTRDPKARRGQIDAR